MRVKQTAVKQAGGLPYASGRRCSGFTVERGERAGERAHGAHLVHGTRSREPTASGSVSG